MKGIDSMKQNINFLIPTSLQPNGAKLLYFKYFISSSRIDSLKYLKYSTLGFKDIWRKNQSLWRRLNPFVIS